MGRSENWGFKTNPNKDGGSTHVWTLGYNTKDALAWVNFKIIYSMKKLNRWRPQPYRNWGPKERLLSPQKFNVAPPLSGFFSFPGCSRAINSQLSLLTSKFTKISFLLEMTENISSKAIKTSWYIWSLQLTGQSHFPVSSLSRAIFCSHNTHVHKKNKDRTRVLSVPMSAAWPRARSLHEASCGSTRRLDRGRFSRSCRRSSPGPPCVSGGRGCRGRRGTRTICHSVCIWRASPPSAAWYVCGGCWRQWTSARTESRRKSKLPSAGRPVKRRVSFPVTIA